MRTTITLVAQALCLSLLSQPIEDQALQKRMISAGIELERAGDIKTQAVPTFITTALLGAIMTQGKTNTERIAGWSMLSATASGMITIRIVVASKERKAGRALQGKPPF